MVWPPQNPDLNIMELVWDYMKTENTLREPKSKKDLCKVLRGQVPWNTVIASVPRIIGAVLKVKSGHNKYWFDVILITAIFMKLIDK